LALDRPATAEPGQGIYRAEAARRVYEHLAQLAESVLGAGFTVIIDAATLQRWQRNVLAQAARRLGLPVALVVCDAPEAVLRQWLRQRAASGADPSDADEAVLERQLSGREPPTATELPLIRVNTERGIEPERLAGLILEAWREGDQSGKRGDA
jgi:uncharacterized protein